MDNRKKTLKIAVPIVIAVVVLVWIVIYINSPKTLADYGGMNYMPADDWNFAVWFYEDGHMVVKETEYRDHPWLSPKSPGMPEEIASAEFTYEATEHYITVDGNMTTFDSHKLADDLEKNIVSLDKVYKAIVHVEPYFC